MMLNNTKTNKEPNLAIYQNYLELVYYTNDILKKFPKSEKFGLITEIKNNLYNGLRLLMYAIKVYNKQEKLKYLNELNINLNLLKIHIRLSYKCQYITIKNYQTWSKHISDICNMLS